jgi:hypothetical protein
MAHIRSLILHPKRSRTTPLSSETASLQFPEIREFKVEWGETCERRESNPLPKRCKLSALPMSYARKMDGSNYATKGEERQGDLHRGEE